VVGLIFHELATNAVKYGALAQERGRIQLSWQERSGRVHMRWRETGVVLDTRSPTPGVGTGIIVDTVPYMLDGSSRLIFHSDGAECLLDFAMPADSEE
jgi:two-component sensor histidine kinase